jgi:hypothetical protein
VNKTNKELAKKYNTTPRQISKSRKTGDIKTNDGGWYKFTAPSPVFKTTNKTGIKKKKGGGMKKWGIK